jgi:hypothetical protein
MQIHKNKFHVDQYFLVADRFGLVHVHPDANIEYTCDIYRGKGKGKVQPRTGHEGQEGE